MSIFNFLNKGNQNKKKLIYALRDIYGIGLTSSAQLCRDLGYDVNARFSELRNQDLNKINSLITVKYKFIIEAELKKIKYDNIQTMKLIKTYKGVRHSYNLPVNGQRMHTNGKTRG